MGRSVVVIGGGFSGCSVAVQLSRRSATPLDIRIVEPGPRLGRGLAYATVDPDHRLNAPTYVHSILPDDAWHFDRWVREHQVLEQDPDAVQPDGTAYVRRSVFARYLDAAVADEAERSGTGSTIVHVRGTAVDVAAGDGRWTVLTAEGDAITADLVVIATGNSPPRLPRAIPASLAAHPGIIESPLDPQRLNAIPPDARTLLVGSGLTALDVLSTLVRRGHRGEIVVMSRHGLRPRQQGPLPPALAKAQAAGILTQLPGGVLLARLMGPVPDFLGGPATVRGWLRALRDKVSEVEAAGGTWYQPFDDLRDALWQLWPRLPVPQRHRFLRHLRVWYDVHRYRSPPQNEALVQTAVDAGRIRFLAGRLRDVGAPDPASALDVGWMPAGGDAPRRERFDRLINCTGLDIAAGIARNALLSALVDRGRLRIDACASGFDVDPNCRAVDAQGSAQPTLRVIGPPTFGTFGDPIGAMFIATQIHRALPDMLASLDAAHG